MSNPHDDWDGLEDLIRDRTRPRWLPVSRWASVALAMAWVCFIASLFLPAASLPSDANGFPPCSLGWEVLLVTLFPLFWLFGLPLLYFLINFTFLVSPRLYWIKTRGQLTRGIIFHLAASIVAVVTLMVYPVCYGSVPWAAAHCLAALAYGLARWDSGDM